MKQMDQKTIDEGKRYFANLYQCNVDRVTYNHEKNAFTVERDNTMAVIPSLQAAIEIKASKPKPKTYILNGVEKVVQEITNQELYAAIIDAKHMTKPRLLDIKAELSPISTNMIEELDPTDRIACIMIKDFNINYRKDTHDNTAIT